MLYLKSKFIKYQALKSGVNKITLEITENADLTDLEGEFFNVSLAKKELSHSEHKMLVSQDWGVEDTFEPKLSCRMRAVLFRLWEQNSEGVDDAEEYYRIKMEGFISHLKNKLEP